MKKVAIILLVFVAFSVIIILCNIPKQNNERKINLISCLDVFKDRTILQKDLKVFVGNNKKEIENGYYDVSMVIENKKLVIEIIKLFKSDYSDSCEDEYLDEICRYIYDKTKKDFEIIRLKNEIKEMYDYMRKNEISKIKYIENKIVIKAENYSLKVIIGDGDI